MRLRELANSGCRDSQSRTAFKKTAPTGTVAIHNVRFTSTSVVRSAQEVV